MTGWTGKHGYSAYANGKCRCDICTQSSNAYQGSHRAERYRITRTKGLPPYVEHGRSAYVNWGCRCDICGAAQAVENAAGNDRRRAQRRKAKEEEAA